jgi:predicted RNase H-like nuclease
LLAEAGIVIPDDLGHAGTAGADDILDAAVAAWSASRIAAGNAISLPDPPQFDTNNRKVAIWY